MATVEESIRNLWNQATAPKDEVDQLVYASNLLGSDPRLTNYGGGNTSSKTVETDRITGDLVNVLWVKASGGDLGTAARDSFAALKLDSLLNLEGRLDHEDDAVELYPYCAFGLNRRPPSIDTPLHAFVPARCVSHLHPDSVIAIAASKDAHDLCEKVWKGRLAFLPWKRPGFDLGLQLRDLIRANPNAQGALMASHGLICWAENWHDCYNLTLDLVESAYRFIESQGRGRVFATPHAAPSAGADDAWFSLLPKLRGLTTYEGHRLIAHVDQGPQALDFVRSPDLQRLAQMGTSCPDHFLRTKVRPMLLREPDKLEEALNDYRSGYEKYYKANREPDSPPMRNPNPSVVLVPDLGYVALGKSAKEARVTAEFYGNAIRVMHGAEAVSTYAPLPDSEAFAIEYWALEEAKLRRMPPESELSRQIAVVTGAAQGIGRATAIRFARLGACVALLDINEDKLTETLPDVQLAADSDESVRAIRCDVTDPASLESAFRHVVLAFGGLDVVVVNAGNARRGSVGETSPADYKLLDSLLIKGYFDTVAGAVKILQPQALGGSIVLVGSKNGVAAGSNAALYSAAKAFELHLMRTVAVDYGAAAIRCNAVNPDGVVTGSGIWTDAWKQQTASTLGISPDELIEYYRKRSILGRIVTPDDCAEAIAWLASEHRSSRTTGCVITVDGGNREGFLR